MKKPVVLKDLSEDKFDQITNLNYVKGGCGGIAVNGSAQVEVSISGLPSTGIEALAAEDSFKIILGDSWGFTFTNCDNSSGTH